MHPAPRPLSAARALQLALVVGLVALLVLALRPAPSRADGITVTTLEDENNTNPGACSLREAIHAATTDEPYGGCPAGAGADTITFKVKGTIHLNTSLDGLHVTSDTLTIQGPGSDHLTIDGGGAVQILQVAAAVQLTLEGLTLANGHLVSAGLSGVGGGAILNYGSLTIMGSTFANNRAAAEKNGGAIYNDGGSLTITDSVFKNNQASSATFVLLESGGAIYNNGGSLTITDSTFSDNQARDNGGAIYHSAGLFTLSGSTFSKNSSTNDKGGAIYLNGGTLNVTTSTFDQNAAYDRAGAIYLNGGTLNLASSTLVKNVSNGYGGAIYSDGGALTITNSTFNNNQARGSDGGGAIYFDNDSLTILSSTFAGNTSGEHAAILIDNGEFSMQNTVLTSTSPNCSGGVADLGGNIASDQSCGLSHLGSLNNTDPLLGHLQDNGGPTQTMALLAGSPAIGAGLGCPPPDTDQRGVTRMSPCDSGAVESGSPPAVPTVTGLSPTSGPAVGGTMVTIEGTGFSTTAGATSVSFGPNPGANVSCSATTRCEATSPAGGGSVDVRVTVDGHTSPDSPADNFSYEPGPSPTPRPTPTPGPTPTPEPTPRPTPTPTPSPGPTPPPSGLSAAITGCTARGSGVYRCDLQVTLGTAAMVGTVLEVSISAATYSNPNGAGSPMVSASEGCANPPNPSPYLAINGMYVRYDVNISTGGCRAGAVVTFAEEVSGRPGTAIMQTISATDHGSASASFTLP